MPSVGARMREALITEPRKFQIQAVRMLERNNGRGILGDSMGLGKTYEAIAWMAIHPEVYPTVVVCPSNVKYQWQRQFKEHAGIDAQVLEGEEPYYFCSDVVIINYTILASNAKWPQGKRRKGARPKFPWVDMLKMIAKPQLVILDEFHYIKNRSSLRTRACIQLCRKAPHLISASGTPIEKGPAEFFPILNLTNKEEFPSYMKYAMRYCDLKKGFRGRGWDDSGAENLDELHERVSPFMIRRLKTEVAKELPPKIRSVIPVGLCNRKVYETAEAHFLEWIEEKYGEEAAERAAGAVGLTKLGVLKRVAAEGKLPSIQTWIEDFLGERDEKLIVFGVHRKILSALQETFPHSVVVKGGVKGRKRQAQVDRFQEDPKCRLFLGQLRAAGVGLDGLHKAASTVFFAELGWNFSEHEQAEDRALRLGQEASSVDVHYMIAQDTVEERILDVIQTKHDICDRVLNGRVRILDLNLFERRRFDGFKLTA